MAKEKSGKDSITPPDNAIPDKKVFWTSKKLETVVAILLGIATLLSAWSSWIGADQHLCGAKRQPDTGRGHQVDEGKQHDQSV